MSAFCQIHDELMRRDDLCLFGEEEFRMKDILQLTIIDPFQKHWSLIQTEIREKYNQKCDGKKKQTRLLLYIGTQGGE